MPSTLIVTERLLDGTGAAAGPGWVHLDGDLIDAVGRGERRDAPAAVEVIDVGQWTVLPGLIDSHTHVAGLLRDEPDPSADGPRVARDVVDALAGLSAVVRTGVTTIRDCGFPHHGIFAVQEALDTGRFPGPRLVLAGRAICATAGHGARLSIEVDGPDAARRAARTEIKAGAAWLKVMVTGGTATPGEEVTDVQMTLDELRAIVAEAHRRGRQVCAHVSNLQGTHLALDAGVDSLEHGIALDDRAVERMAEAGVWLVSTLQCTKIEGEAGPESGIPEYTRRKGAEIYRQQMESFRRALAGGVRIAAGTDAAVPYLRLEMASLVAEMRLMALLGMPTASVLASATSEAARFLGRDGQIGTLQPGASADLIVVEGDPLEDLAALERPSIVVSRGVIIHQSAVESEEGVDRGARG